MLKMLNTFKLRTRILLGYAPAMTMMVILGFIIYTNFLQAQQRVEDLRRLRTFNLSVNKSAFDLSGVIRTMRGQLLFPNDPTYLARFEEQVRAFQEHSSDLNNLTQNVTPDRQQLVAACLVEANRLVQGSVKTIQAFKTGNVKQALQLVENVRLSQFEENLDKLQAAIDSEEKDAKAAEAAAISFFIVIVSVGTLIVIILSLGAGLVISQVISQSIHGATTEIVGASTEIATTMEEQERIANSQAASVNAATTTMDELEASCRQSAEQAQAAVVAASQALALATTGTQSVAETMEGMFVMEKKVESIAEQIMQLSEQANQIASIASLVSELANQTNMIALNSSVEAVRAGESGKGFAVVATEIRKLSDHSQQSADKINALVSEIQKAVNSSVMVIDEGTKIVKGNVQTVQRMEQSFVGVTESVNQVVMNNQQVSLNLKQQVDAIQEVAKAMDTINKGARETAAGLMQTRKGAVGLNDVAATLNNLI